MEGGHEIASHGYLHENPSKLTPEEELYWFDRQVDVIKKMTRKSPRGWRAPLYNYSKSSIDFMIDKGMIYDASLMGDDIPYVLQTDKGQVIELPSQWAMDDWPHYTDAPDMHYMMPIKSPDEAMNVFMSEFEAMRRHQGLWITVWHPFVSGRLARCERVSEMIEYMQEHRRCLVCDNGRDRQSRPKMHRRRFMGPQIDKLPYYDAPIPELKDGTLLGSIRQDHRRISRRSSWKARLCCRK